MKLITLSALCILTSLATAQTLLYNNGATIKIQTGATLYVEGGVENTASGTLDNDGTLEIKGDLTNLGTWEASNPNTLKFSGAAHSNVNAGSAQFHDVVVQKDATFNVNLVTTDMTINNNLDFAVASGSTRVVTGDKILKLGPVTTVTGAGATKYIATTGTLGMVEKTVTANGSFTFPIGDLTNYTPLANVYTGTLYTNAKLSARSNDATHPSIPGDASDYISRFWDINHVGITGYANTLTGTYATSGDVVGTSSLIKGAVHNGSAWSYVDASNGVGTVIGKTTHPSSDFTGTNFFGKVNIIAFLHGAYNTGTGMMSTTLTSDPDIWPLMLISPYTDAPDTVVTIPADVTDWVKLELRDPLNPATVLGRKSAFIKKTGHIVDVDGTSFPLIKNGLPTSIVAVVHRTHLSIRTPNAGIDVVNPTEHDFSLDTLMAYNNTSNLTNNSMRLMSNGKYAMWGGNGNSNANVRYGNAQNDRDFLLGTILGGDPTLVIQNAYSRGDYNMNGIVRYGNAQNDRDFLLAQVLSGNPTSVITQHF